MSLFLFRFLMLLLLFLVFGFFSKQQFPLWCDARQQFVKCALALTWIKPTLGSFNQKQQNQSRPINWLTTPPCGDAALLQFRAVSTFSSSFTLTRFHVVCCCRCFTQAWVHSKSICLMSAAGLVPSHLTHWVFTQTHTVLLKQIVFEEQASSCITIIMQHNHFVHNWLRAGSHQVSRATGSFYIRSTCTTIQRWATFFKQTDRLPHSPFWEKENGD